MLRRKSTPKLNNFVEAVAAEAGGETGGAGDCPVVISACRIGCGIGWVGRLKDGGEAGGESSSSSYSTWRPMCLLTFLCALLLLKSPFWKSATQAGCTAQ